MLKYIDDTSVACNKHTSDFKFICLRSPHPGFVSIKTKEQLEAISLKYWISQKCKLSVQTEDQIRGLQAILQIDESGNSTTKWRLIDVDGLAFIVRLEGPVSDFLVELSPQ